MEAGDFNCPDLILSFFLSPNLSATVIALIQSLELLVYHDLHNFKFKLTSLFVCISYFLKRWASKQKGTHHEMVR